MPLNFTVLYNDKVNDVNDVTGDVGTVPGIGPLYMIPQFPAGTRLPAPLENTGYGTRAFMGYLDGDGILKSEAGGTEGMRVWANDPIWDIERFQYLVKADLTDTDGRAVAFAPFFVDAKDVDEIMYLAREMPRPGQSFGRGRPGWGVGDPDVNGFGQLVIMREDGVELGTVTIPELSETLAETAAQSIAYTMTFGH